MNFAVACKVFYNDKWTDKSLDLFIAQMKLVFKQRGCYRSVQDFFNEVQGRMAKRGSDFEIADLMEKWQYLREKYMDKTLPYEDLEPDLIQLLNEVDSSDSAGTVPLRKKPKLEQKQFINFINNMEMQNHDLHNDNLTIWSNEATEAFLELFKMHRPQTSKTMHSKETAVHAIREELSKQGFKYSVVQVYMKWKEVWKQQFHTEPPPITAENLCDTNFDSPFNPLGPLFEGEEDKLITTSNDYHFNGMPYTAYDDDFTEDSLNSNIDFDKDEILEPDYLELKSEIKEEIISDKNTPDIDDDEYHLITEDGDVVSVTSEKSRCKNRIKHESTISPDVIGPTDSNSSISTYDELMETKLDDNCKYVVNDMTVYRIDKLQLEREKIELKRLQLEAYKERTTELSRIGRGITELVKSLNRTK